MPKQDLRQGTAAELNLKSGDNVLLNYTPNDPSVRGPTARVLKVRKDGSTDVVYTEGHPGISDIGAVRVGEEGNVWRGYQCFVKLPAEAEVV